MARTRFATRTYLLPALLLNPVLLLHTLNTLLSRLVPLYSPSTTTAPTTPLPSWGPAPTKPHFDMHASDNLCWTYTVFMVSVQLLAFGQVSGAREARRERVAAKTAAKAAAKAAAAATAAASGAVNPSGPALGIASGSNGAALSSEPHKSMNGKAGKGNGNTAAHCPSIPTLSSSSSSNISTSSSEEEAMA